MKKHLKRKSYSGPSQIEPTLSGLIIKMQPQLAFLEKKIDVLISQITEAPFDGQRNSRPFQRYDRPNRQGESRQGADYRERVLHKAICADCNKECEVPFRPSQDRPVYCKECFSKRKTGSAFKANNYDRTGGKGPARERPFHKHHGGENRRPYEAKRIPGKRKKREPGAA